MGIAVAAGLRSSFFAGALALLGASTASATEICVKCTAPDASYSCVVNTPANSTIDTVIKLYCITALAKSGAHASCAIDRSTTSPCQGQRRELPVPTALDDAAGDGPPQRETATPGANAPSTGSRNSNLPAATESVAPPPGQGGTASGQAQQPPREPAADAPPKTVQEMVEKSAKSAGDGLSNTQKSAGEAAKSASTALEKAGSAVGDAAKNSWRCLSSFFSNC